MVAFYVNKINNGEMTIEKVPKLWNEKVKLELEKQVLSSL